MIEANINDDAHLRIFERYIIGVGMTPRMVTNVDTGENYRDGEAAAKLFGVTRQNISNCINGRQATVKGCRLVRSHRFRRELLEQFVEICEEHGTDAEDVIEAFREL